MAHIFKYPYQGNRGIIVFTHKEIEFFVRSKTAYVKGMLKKPHKTRLFSLFEPSQIRKRILSISDKFFIGVHIGWYRDEINLPDWVDFVMSAPGNGEIKTRQFHIPLVSANFTPDVMRPTGEPKYWDILTVAKSANVKRYDELMRSVRALYDEGKFYYVLFVIASNLKEESDRFYTEILDDYYKNFSALERERFTIIKTHPQTGFQGLSYTFLAHIYNQSKIFSLFSQQEGESRVIKEAQMCGLPVVVKRDLAGGGTDYLDDTNAVFFDEYDGAPEALKHAVENHSKFDIKTEKIAQLISESVNNKKLYEYFSDLYRVHGESFDGILVNTDNLNRRLPAHFFDESVPWAVDPSFRFKTTDIVNEKMFNNFWRCLGNPPEK